MFRYRYCMYPKGFYFVKKKKHSGSAYVGVEGLSRSSGVSFCQNGSSITISNCSCFDCCVCLVFGFRIL